MASTLLESLRKKYGQYNFSDTGPRTWIYALSGKLPGWVVNPAGPCTAVDGENGELPRGSGGPGDYGQISLDTTKPETLPRQINSPACVPYVAFVARGVAEETPPNSQISQLTTTLLSGALVSNSGRATYNWLKGEADARAKELQHAANAPKRPQL